MCRCGRKREDISPSCMLVVPARPQCMFSGRRRFVSAQSASKSRLFMNYPPFIMLVAAGKVTNIA